MLRDLLVENSLNNQFKMISSFGHSKLNQELMKSQWLSFNTKERQRNSNLNRFHPWSSKKWKKLPKHISEKMSKMLSSQFQPISMTHKDKLQRMQEPFLVSMFSELSMNQQPPLLLTVLIDNQNRRKIFLSSILVVVLLMFHFLLLRKVFSKLKQLMDILI